MLGNVIVRREPVGVVAAIVPWNVPQFVIMMKLGPALAAGATVVVKPAPETPLDCIVLADAIREAGLPKGVVNIVPAGREVGEYLVRHADVDKVAFTGSTAAGRRIAALCGEQLKRCTLELGGKSAAIVLDDADLEATISGADPGRDPEQRPGLRGADAHPRLAARAIARWSTRSPLPPVRCTVGDPSEFTTVVGPLVAARQRDRVEGYIRIGREEGAKVAVGGGRPAGLTRGWYVEPTRVRRRRQPHAHRARGDLRPGAVGDPLRGRGRRGAHRQRLGLRAVGDGVDERHRPRRRGRPAGADRHLHVNGFMMDFGAPFGGFKSSGIGRELGPEGLIEYLEPKSIALPMGYTPTLAY